MLFRFTYKGLTETEESLDRIVAKAEELWIENGKDLDNRVVLYCNPDNEWRKLVEIPTEDASDERFLTKDWKICYEKGCCFLRVKNGNLVFCGKKHNPNSVFEQQTTPRGCPVKFSRLYRENPDCI